MDNVDVDELVDKLQERVATRRAMGDYPPGLEEQLEAEFKLIMDAVHRREVNTGDLEQRIAAVSQAIHAVGGPPEFASRLPGGQSVHRTAGRVVERHTGVLANHVRTLGDNIAGALQEILHLIEMQNAADERQLHEVVSAVLDRVAVIDHLADAVVDLELRVRELETKSAIA